MKCLTLIFGQEDLQSPKKKKKMYHLSGALIKFKSRKYSLGCYRASDSQEFQFMQKGTKLILQQVAGNIFLWIDIVSINSIEDFKPNLVIIPLKRNF